MRVGFDPAVDEMHAAVHARGHIKVVGDGDDGLAAFAHQVSRIWKTCSEFFESRLPVGSSASTTGGSFARSGKRRHAAIEVDDTLMTA